MKVRKKLSVYLLLLILVFNSTACTKNTDYSYEATPENTNTTGWEFLIEEFHISESLNDISTTVEYGGVSSSSEVSQEPESGKVFLLIKMVIEKRDGSETIDWSNMSLVDSSGNTYSRLHDSFIENFGFKRMKGTTLSFGKNEGWIAFEVNNDSEDFKLEYNASGGIFILDLED